MRRHSRNPAKHLAGRLGRVSGRQHVAPWTAAWSVTLQRATTTTRPHPLASAHTPRSKAHVASHGPKLCYSSTIYTNVTTPRNILPRSIYAHKAQLMITTFARDDIRTNGARINLNEKCPFSELFFKIDKFYIKTYFDLHWSISIAWNVKTRAVTCFNVKR